MTKWDELRYRLAQWRFYAHRWLAGQHLQAVNRHIRTMDKLNDIKAELVRKETEET